MRTLTATAIAPLAVVPVLTVLFGPWTIAHGGMRSWLGIIGPALIVSYVLLVLAGLPMHWALMWQQRTRIRDYALAGALLGAVPVIGYVIVAVAFEAKFMLSAMPHAFARNLEWGSIGVFVFGMCATVIAVVFRMIALPLPVRLVIAR